MKPTFRLIGLLAASAAGWVAASPGQDPKMTPAMEAPADLDAFIASMGLEEKVGQLFVTAGNANFLNEGSPEFQRLRHDVVDRHVGGIIWFRSKVYETAVLSARLQSFAKIPLLFTADLEAGMGMRFDDTPWAPWAMGVAATGDPALAEKLGFATAVEARALGVAQIYAPVADVNVNADNPVINTRSFGEDPKDVARFVTAFVKGCERGGVLATVKHFPGHGDTATDSHRSLPLITADRKRLDAVELLPFREAFRQGCRSVMIAHIAVPALDPTPAPARKERETKVYGGDEETQTQGTLPATVSPAIVHDLLRKELGFDGLVVTDAMDMGGLADHFTPEEGAIRAILAGCDQILKSGEPERAMNAVLAAAKSGRIPIPRIDASVKRVLREKVRLGLFTPEKAAPPLSEVGTIVGNASTQALIDEIARRSITLVREAPGVLPLAGKKSITCVVICDDNTPLPAAMFQATLAPHVMGAMRGFRIDPRSTPDEAKEALAECQRSDAIVLALVVRARTGAGKIEPPPAAKLFLAGVFALEKPIVGVSLGSPYVIRDIPQLATYLVAYGNADCSQRAAAAALCGGAPIVGKLPVTIPGIAERGAGIQKEAAK